MPPIGVVPPSRYTWVVFAPFARQPRFAPPSSSLETSAGHDAPVPVHVSATSHAPVAERQIVPEAASASAGHATALPVHVSTTSHAPAAERQTVNAGARASGGHAGDAPVQA